MIKDIAFNIYAVTDMVKSRAFYEGKLGLVPNGEFDTTDNPSWVEYNIGAGTFAIGCSPDWKPSQDGASIALEVDNFDSFVQELKGKGIEFFLEPQNYPTCQMAVITDPDKNKIVIHQKKK